jgi:hypothetical protein
MLSWLAGGLGHGEDLAAHAWAWRSISVMRVPVSATTAFLNTAAVARNSSAIWRGTAAMASSQRPDAGSPRIQS